LENITEKPLLNSASVIVNPWKFYWKLRKKGGGRGNSENFIDGFEKIKFKQKTKIPTPMNSATYCAMAAP